MAQLPYNFLEKKFVVTQFPDAQNFIRHIPLQKQDKDNGSGLTRQIWRRIVNNNIFYNNCDCLNSPDLEMKTIVIHDANVMKSNNKWRDLGCCNVHPIGGISTCNTRTSKKKKTHGHGSYRRTFECDTHLYYSCFRFYNNNVFGPRPRFRWRIWWLLR